MWVYPDFQLDMVHMPDDILDNQLEFLLHLISMTRTIFVYTCKKLKMLHSSMRILLLTMSFLNNGSVTFVISSRLWKQSI